MEEVSREYYNKMLSLAQKLTQVLSKDFYLAGGTAIMLKYKHRTSTDLDFFSYKMFSFNYWKRKISKKLPAYDFQIKGDNMDFFIEGVKISLVRFYYKNIKKVGKLYSIRLASDYDLLLNKIYFAGRRIEWKDPYDSAFLLKQNTWHKQQIKKDFEKKFEGSDYQLYVGALLYKEDYPNLPHWVWKELEKLI